MKDEEELKRFLSPKSASYINQLQITDEADPNYDDWDDEDDEDDDDVIHYIEPGSEEEKEGVREAKLTLEAMYMSFVLLTLVFLAIGLLIFDKRLTYLAGISTGMITGFFYISHLNSSIKEILNYDEESAARAMKKDATIRITVVGIVGILVAAFVGGNAAIGVLVQMFSLKLSVYLTPVITGILKKGVSKYNNKPD